MSKAELNKEFESWIISEDFTPVKEKYLEFSEKMRLLKAETEKGQKEAHESSDEAQEDFEYREDKDDARFNELREIYREKRIAIEKQKRQELEDNLQTKKRLIEELKALIQDEENIGQAYKKFDEIKVGWQEVGNIPADKRRDIQAEYSRLIEQFYYNIKIYRELQQNDFKHNQEAKLAVIEKIKALSSESSINQVDYAIHQFLDEWDSIGPTFRDEWEKIRDDFRAAVNEVFDRIKAHRKEVKEEHQSNLNAKSTLVEKVKSYLDLDLDDVKKVQQYTREIIEVQKEWKNIGFAGRGKNDTIWKEFRAACDEYFDKRRVFLEASNKKFAVVKEKKKELIEKAKSVYQGEDVDKIANTLKGLQREWKQTGRLLPQEEYKLFKEFRGYCDSFFERKKNQAEQAEQAFTANLKAKEELLATFAKEVETDVKEKGEALIEDWKKRWAEVGEVAPRMVKKVENGLSDVISEVYKSLGISKEEVEAKHFDAKMDILSSKQDPIEALKKERNSIASRIKDAQVNVVQLEGKLDFFKFSDDKNPLKKDVLHKIEKAQGEVDKLRAKKKRVDLKIKEIQNAAKAAEEAAPAEEASE